jgi:hypothetical protein
MGKGREGVMLLEEATGVHLPRALTGLIASIGPVGAAFSAMLPILGVVAAIEVVSKLVQAHEKAATAARELGNVESEASTKGMMALQGLGDRLLEAQIKTDELAGNHIAALSKQLELLDHQSLKELMEEFDKFGAEADRVFAKVKANTSFWEVWSHGSDNAKSALNDFKTQYDALIAKGDTEGAGDLLKGTLESALKVQQAQKGYNVELNKTVRTAEEQSKLTAAAAVLDEAGIQASKNDLVVQQSVVGALQDQLSAATLINQTKAVTGGTDQIEAAKIAASDAQKLTDIKIDGIKQEKDAQASLLAIYAETDAIHHKTTDRGDPGKVAQDEIAAHQAEFEKTNTLNSDAYDDKKSKLDAELNAVGTTAQRKLQIIAEEANLEEAVWAQYETAEATRSQKGAQATATANAEKLKLTEESIAKLNELTDKSAEQQSKFIQENYKAEESALKQATAAGEEVINSAVAHGTITQKQATAAKIALIQQELAAKQAAMLKEVGLEEQQLQVKIDAAKAAGALQAAAGVNKGDQGYIDYLSKADTLTKQQIQLVNQLRDARQLEGATAAAAIKKEQDALTPFEQKMKQVQSQFNSDFAKMVISGQSFGKSMKQLTSQLLEQWIEYEMKRLETSLMDNVRHISSNAQTNAALLAQNASAGAAQVGVQQTQDKTSLLSSADKAAGKAWAAAPNPILGAIEAAAAWMGVMAFAEGGTVPGSGTGDTVPAMLSPHETVVSAALTRQVEDAQGSSGKSGGDVHHHFTYAPNVQAIDSNGVESMLKRHAATFNKHVSSVLRKQNKRAA